MEYGTHKYNKDFLHLRQGSPGGPQVYCVDKDNFELLNLLPLSLAPRLDSVLPCVAYTVLGLSLSIINS